MSSSTVLLRVPADAGYVSLLRTAVWGYASRDRFTLDQLNDLRLAVDEAAVHLLRNISSEHLELSMHSTDRGIEVSLQAELDDGAEPLDQQSFCWLILNALSDELQVTERGPVTVLVLKKHRLTDAMVRDSE